MMPLPTGTVTFLFTDIEGSTKAWEAHPEAMSVALARHDALMREAIGVAGGIVFKTVGDGFYAAFASPSRALEAVVAAQRHLQHEPWLESTPIRVRMALHTGIAERRDDDYFGTVLNRTARLLSTGHGGQALVSAAAYELVRDHLPEGVGLRDLGLHRLKDLERPEQVFQVIHPDLIDDFAPLRSLDNVPNNLPQQLTSFIGRESAMAEVRVRLDKTRLLTLTGSGGSGKTRLALQAAAEVLEANPDGAWLVELAPIADPALVGQTIAAVLSVKEKAGQGIQQSLIDSLKRKHLLLVLDNCEHLVAACAQLTAVLLRSCPEVSILATSREPLGIAGEKTYRVPSLSLPDPQQARAATAQSVSQYEAVRLFIERAQAVKPEFLVTNGNAPALAQLCHRLDGIPLAIELAAARVRSLSVEAINDRLDRRFRLLTGGDRSALPRQQTLRALVDWSYDLLTDAEKTLLSRLSVFSGGWTLSAAESVCGFDPLEEWDVLDLLTSLVDKSLVVVEGQESAATAEATAATRYRMLETLRQYATEKQEERSETAAVKGRHWEWFTALAEEADPQLRGPEQTVWLTRLETEHDNLRAALDWCDTDAGEAGLRLSKNLWWFWRVRGYVAEGRERLGNAVEKMNRHDALSPAAVSLLSQALNGAGILATFQGDFEAAQSLLERSLVLCRETEDTSGIMGTLNSLGNLAYARGDFESARPLYEESLVIRRALSDAQGIATSLNNLANIAYAQGDFDAAWLLYEESVARYRELGNRQGMAIPLNSLGFIANVRGETAQARSLHEESLRILYAMGDKSGIADALEGLARVALSETAARDAVVLWGASTALRTSIGSPLPPSEQAEHEELLDQARAALSVTNGAVYALAWNEGRGLTWEQAVRYALRGERGSE